MLCVCVGDVMDVVFSVCIVRRLHVCVLCASCGSSQRCVLHDLQFVNAGRGCNRRPYRRGILQKNKNKNCLFRNYMLCSVHVYGKKQTFVVIHSWKPNYG